MNRRNFMGSTLALAGWAILPLAFAQGDTGHNVTARDWDLTPLDRDPEYWRDLLAKDAWRVLFREHTEPAGSSPLNAVSDQGTYICRACHLPLFSSDTKYESGTGWPSFWGHFPGHVGTRRDFRLFIPRTEYHCIRCRGHQGHVFDDGPEPTGKRWCNNGLALRFVPAGESLPALRG